MRDGDLPVAETPTAGARSTACGQKSTCCTKWRSSEGSAAKERPVRQRSVLAATCGWFQEDDERPGYLARCRRPSERKAAREDVHDPEEAWRPGVSNLSCRPRAEDEKQHTASTPTASSPGQCTNTGQWVRSCVKSYHTAGVAALLASVLSRKPHCVFCTRHMYILVPTGTPFHGRAA